MVEGGGWNVGSEGGFWGWWRDLGLWNGCGMMVGDDDCGVRVVSGNVGGGWVMG